MENTLFHSSQGENSLFFWENQVNNFVLRHDLKKMDNLL